MSIKIDVVIAATAAFFVSTPGVGAAPPDSTTKESPAGASSRAPFGGAPRSIPGLIEAEDFDEGPEGVAFHDADEWRGMKKVDGYRKTTVDLEKASGKIFIGRMFKDEWLEYTVDVKKTGVYDLEVSLAGWKPGTFQIAFDGMNAGDPIAVPNTGGWNKLGTVTRSGIKLKKGKRIMRVTINDRETCNLEAFKFVAAGELGKEKTGS